MRKKTLLRRAAWGLAWIFCLIAAAIFILAGTAPGLRILSSALQSAVPGLRLGAVEGTLLDFRLEGASYDSDAINASVSRLTSKISVLGVFPPNILIEKLEVEDPALALKETAATGEPAREDGGPLSFSFPGALAAKSARVSRFSFKGAGADVFFDSFSSRFSLKGHSLDAEEADLSGLSAGALPEASPGAGAPVSGDALEKALSGAALVLPERISLPLDVSIQNFTGANWRLYGRPLTRISLEGSAKDGLVTVKGLSIEAPEGSISASGGASLNGSYPVSAVISAKAAQGASSVFTGAEASLSGELLGETKVSFKASGRSVLTGSASVKPAVRSVPISLSAALDRFGEDTLRAGTKTPAWELTGAVLTLTGTLSEAAVSGSAKLGGASFAQTSDISLKGKLSPKHSELTFLAKDARKAWLDAAASASFGKTLLFGAGFTLTDPGLKASSLIPEKAAGIRLFPMKASASGGFKGEYDPALGLLSLKTQDLAADILAGGVPYRLRAALGLSPREGQGFADIAFSAAKNRLSFKAGFAHEKMDASLGIAAPDLSGISREWAGKASGSVKASGARTAPEMKADITASGVAIEGLSFDQLRVKSLFAGEKEPTGSFSAVMKNLALFDEEIADSAELLFKGSLSKHSASFKSAGRRYKTDIALNGASDPERKHWEASLLRADLGAGRDTLKLAAPVGIRLDLEKGRLSYSRAAWKSSPLEFSLEAAELERFGAKGEASATLARFDIAFLRRLMPWLGPSGGLVAGSARAAWDFEASALPELDAELSAKDLKIARRAGAISFGDAKAALTLHAGKAKLSASCALGGAPLDFALEANDILNDGALEGRLTASPADLSFVSGFLTGVERTAGRVSGDIRISGTYLRPRLSGAISASGLIAEGPSVPFEMEPSSALLSFSGAGAGFKATLLAKEGALDLTGGASWDDIADWSASIRARTGSFKIGFKRMFRATLTSDVEMRAQPDKIDLSGEITLPRAFLKIESLPDSVPVPSEHEIALNDRLEPVESRAASMEVTSTLALKIGRAFVDAYGLKTGITGDLRVGEASGALGLNGQLRLINGRFKAYGQDLVIRKGEINFVGPASDPALNIEAIRNPEATSDNVIAGVRVTGPASSPATSVFSEPAMAQTAALSYLIKGEGLEGDDGNNAMLTNLIIQAGTAGAGQLVSRLGEALSIRGLSLSSEGTGDASQVVVSGYLAPGLMIKYGMGIFDSLSTFTLRYRLLPKLYLEAVMGNRQKVGVAYALEF